MMNVRISVAAGLIALAGATDAFAQYRHGYQSGGRGAATGPVEVGARYRLWMAQLDGDIEAEDGGLGGTDVSLDSTLGLDEKKKIHDIAVWLPNLPFVGKLHAQYWRADFGQSEPLASDVIFAGTTFAGGSVVRTDMHWDAWSFLWEYGGQVPGMSNLPGSTGITGQFGFKYFTVDTRLADAAQTADAKMVGVIPVIGLNAQMTFGSFLALGAEINGARALGISGIDGVLFDAVLSAHVEVSGFYAGAGYRWFKVDLTDDSPRSADEVDLDLYVEGFFLEGGLRF